MKALIFAAGLGTRLKPITDTIPKALVPVGGVPMLERVILKLKAAGISDFVVNTCYFADKVEAFLRGKENFGVRIAVSREAGPEPLETGGGMKFARSLLEDGGPFLAYNVDILSDLDLEKFLGSCRKDALANLLVTPPKSSDNRFFLFDDAMDLVGWTNTSTGEIRGEVSDPAKCKRMSFSGIHLISPDIFPLFESWPERFSITAFYIAAAAGERIHGVLDENLEITDIGSPAALEEANRIYSSRI